MSVEPKGFADVRCKREKVGKNDPKGLPTLQLGRMRLLIIKIRNRKSRSYVGEWNVIGQRTGNLVATYL